MPPDVIFAPDMKTVPLAGGTYLLGHADDSIQAAVDLRDWNWPILRKMHAASILAR